MSQQPRAELTAKCVILERALAEGLEREVLALLREEVGVATCTFSTFLQGQTSLHL